MSEDVSRHYAVLTFLQQSYKLVRIYRCDRRAHQTSVLRQTNALDRRMTDWRWRTRLTRTLCRLVSNSSLGLAGFDMSLWVICWSNTLVCADAEVWCDILLHLEFMENERHSIHFNIWWQFPYNNLADLNKLCTGAFHCIHVICICTWNSSKNITPSKISFSWNLD